MMMVFKRREVLVGALILLIGVAALINYNYARQPEGQPESVTASQTATDEFTEHSQPTSEDVQSGKKLGEAQYVSSTVDSKGYFADSRISRESARSKSIEMLTAIVNNPNSDSVSKQKAQEEIMRIAELTDKETMCENLIRAKGFEDAVVYVDGENATVTVKSAGLSVTDTVKIQEIVSSGTNIDIKNIKIVEVK